MTIAHAIPDRQGTWATSCSGRRYYPADPSPADVDIRNIAGSLSRICRFNGHLRDDVEMYTVAQHSVLVSLICPPEFALLGLLHDAAESKLGDPIRPIHSLLGHGYWRAQKEWNIAIAVKLGLPMMHLAKMRIAVKRADVIALVTEVRDLTNGDYREYGYGVEPLADRIVPMRPFDARESFMLRYAELTGVSP